MSMLTLNNDCLASVTAVPDLFLEQYMPAANGEFVKVYLYLLKLVKDLSLIHISEPTRPY